MSEPERNAEQIHPRLGMVAPGPVVVEDDALAAELVAAGFLAEDETAAPAREPDPEPEVEPEASHDGEAADETPRRRRR